MRGLPNYAEESLDTPGLTGDREAAPGKNAGNKWGIKGERQEKREGGKLGFHLGSRTRM